MDRVPFVGREHERALAERLLDGVAAGCGATLLVAGEPGIGKTRLLEELAASAERRGALVLRGRCAAASSEIPYFALVEVVEEALRCAPAAALRRALGGDGVAVVQLVPELRDVFPDLSPPALAPGAKPTDYLTAGVVRFASQLAEQRILTVIVDDIQWADEATLLALERLAHAGRVLLACANREDELHRGGALRHGVERLAGAPTVHRLTLGPLGLPGVAELLQALGGGPVPDAVVAAMHEHTDGNPFFVEEMFRHLAEEGRLFGADGAWTPQLELGELDVPAGVLALVERRLERLPPAARELLTVAAIIGRRFEIEVVRSACELDEDALLGGIGHAQLARLVLADRAHPGTLAFTHELVRQTLLGALPAARRRSLHARVAGAIEAMAGASLPARAPELVHHLTAAGSHADPDQLRSYLLLAGDQALERAAFREGAGAFRRALELAGATGARPRAEALERLGRAQRSMGRVEEALASWREASALFAEAGDVDAAARAALAMAYQLGWTGRYPESAEVAQRALRLPGLSDGPVRGGLLGRVAVALSHRDSATAKHTIDEAMRLAESGDDPRLLSEVLQNAMFCHWNDLDLRELVDEGLRAAPLLRAAGDAWGLAHVLALVEIALVHLGRFGEARHAGEELGDLPERVGHRIAELVALRAQALRELAELGDLRRFRLAMARDLKLNESAGLPWLGYSHAYLGSAAFQLGRWDEARRNLDTAARHELPGSYAGVQEAVRLLHEAYLGPTAETAERLRELAEVALVEDGWSHAGCARLVAAVEGLATIGELDRSGRLHERVDAWIERGMVCSIPTFRLLQRVAGIAAGAAGSWEAADRHFAEALRQSEELPHRIEQAETRRAWADALIRRGRAADGPRIGELLTEAAARYHQLDMPRHAELADISLRRASLGTVNSRPPNVFRREADYWELVFEGQRIRLRDSKGLRYLARLLAEPGREFHAADLALGEAGEHEGRGGSRRARTHGAAVAALGPAGEVLDRQARSAYRRRIAELEDDLAKAERHQDSERAARARDELDILTAELAGALGLGGRPRLAADPLERARKAVSNRIRASIARIGAEHEPLALHLDRAVQTGTLCSYRPERPAGWSL